ncbi:DUF402 domain-containing protein [Alicyclobacillus sp. ALC3]|uniref:DUF402 domain-containing protein n=1 Tax=Alicyclobacillus sp. ALC3 TaxID=2796143 RepID=UPI002379FE82|nr:DUF402 domain-containing protein [Alicyclobacillus sp. ALC3]WDL98675.1 DUF402 domain-containing protein [Alicyclobacillus sp. ALC3]
MTVSLVSTHWNGTAHRVWQRAEPYLDAWSFLIEAGDSVLEADGRVWSSPYPVVAWFWPEAFYQVFLLQKDSGAEYYCNVITPPQYDGLTHSVQFCDLDIDVRVDVGGVRVVDEDEFAQRRVNYPSSLVAAALAARDTLVTLANARQGPFSAAAAARFAAAAAR